MNSFNKIKLTDLAKRQSSLKNDKLDLVLYDLDYLGNLEIESKYLQASTIPWLISQIKLLELNKRINSISIEINVNQNSLITYKNDLKSKAFTLASKEQTKRTELINHKLTNIFKLTQLSFEKSCFAYFYRQDASFNYTLHAFSSNKSNLVQALSEFQMNALKLHDNNNTQCEKMFDFKIVNKMILSKEHLNNPNFIDSFIKNEPTAQQILIKFTSNKLWLEITNEKSIEKDYHHIVYLNTSITNKNYFCLAYTDNTDINGLILYSNHCSNIDEVIREYAFKISTDLSSSKRQLSSKLEQHTCFLCPMQQYIELCQYLNQFESNDEKIYQILNEKINHSLDKQDQNYLLDCLNEQNLNLNSYEDLMHTNQLLVGLIQRLCKSKQNQHLISSFNPNKTNESQEFTFFLMKHPKPTKSLTSNLVNNENCCPNNKPEVIHKKRNKTQRSNTIETSQVIDLFDSNSKTKRNNKQNDQFLKSLQIKRNANTNMFTFNSKTDSSIRRYIFNKIVGAPNTFFNYNNTSYQSKSDDIDPQTDIKRFKIKYDALQLWKKVISEQILLIKMEKENKRLRQKALADLTLNQSNRFSYLEITPCLKEVDKIWQAKLDNKTILINDTNEIKSNLCKGVPQCKRGDVWFWLIKQYKLRNKIVIKSDLKMNVSYQELLKQYSINQHSILLDLGRTFPNHANFKYQTSTENEAKMGTVKYGLGQLALFNVLKAYSIMDNEVGYCQGLSFVVGFLLIQLNNDEEKAFELLKFLLIDLDLREQYLPHMKDLQKHMYQLSRLINENCSDVYFHLENNEISTSLYAASWFLTLFSSQFQMGFIARVFDFLFFEGKIVLFKLSLAILTIHKPILLSCNSFENIVDQLKVTIPEMSLIESELIINKSINCEISQLLNNYEIEFNILNEEFDILSNIFSNVQETKIDKRVETDKQQQMKLNQLDLDNSKLQTKVEDLSDKLKISHLKLENQEDYILKLYHENRQLKVRIDTLEIERDVILKKVHQQQEKLYFNTFKK